MENRLKKLLNEDERLRKQTNLALKHQDFADSVMNRRGDDCNTKNNWLADRENRRLAAKARNDQRREENKQNINSSKHRVFSHNIYSRQ